MAVKTVLILLVCCVELFMLQPFQEDSFMTESFDYASQNNQDFREGHVFVQSADPDQEAWLGQPQKYSVFCGKDAVEVVLPTGPLSEVKILGSSILDPVLEATKECGYSLTKEQGNNVLYVSFSGCHVTVEVGVNMHFVFCSVECTLCHISLVSVSRRADILCGCCTVITWDLLRLSRCPVMPTLTWHHKNSVSLAQLAKKTVHLLQCHPCHHIESCLRTTHEEAVTFLLAKDCLVVLLELQLLSAWPKDAV
ncbi:uncharacterized protein LOC128600490 [Ictalurus furcatus]|uniref:uncharacterized protein LOC128600490 n=1 Tax=Ictalurus furcatus TaxID=66913 RepID=UPI00234FFD22|nr:uncharacterized protein LOC128600490 [Ictalurus furcatus]